VFLRLERIVYYMYGRENKITIIFREVTIYSSKQRRYGRFYGDLARRG